MACSACNNNTPLHLSVPEQTYRKLGPSEEIRLALISEYRRSMKKRKHLTLVCMLSARPNSRSYVCSGSNLCSYTNALQQQLLHDGWVSLCPLRDRKSHDL